MGGIGELKDTAVAYCQAIRQLVTKPKEYFEQEDPLPDYRAKLCFALPPILLYAVAETVVQNSPYYMFLLHLLAPFAGIALWTVALKYVLIPFGEKRTFKETLHISASVSFVYALAWIPRVGPPLSVIAAGIWTVLGLTYNFKMNSGAALTAVALPVVISGIVGAALSFLLILAASISRIFSSP